VTQEIDAIMIQTMVISLFMMFFIIIVTWVFLRRIIIAPVDLLKNNE